MKTRTLNLVYLTLVALTTASWLYADSSAPDAAGSQISGIALLLGIAGLKLFMVQAWFMELKHCRPIFLRAAIGFDVLLIALIVLGFSQA